MNLLSDRRERLSALLDGQGVSRAAPPLLLPAGPYFDLAGEEFGRRMLLVSGDDGEDWCLRPDFTLPIAMDYLRHEPGTPRAFGYLGPVFRRREGGPAEFDQAGLELLAEPDPDRALTRVLGFAGEALELFSVPHPVTRIGSVALFEATLRALDLPEAWRPRIRNRFGHVPALSRLLDRLAAGGPETPAPLLPREVLVEDIAQRMVAAGLSLSEGRGPDEIADRFLEQHALEAEPVPPEALAILRRYLAISGPAAQALDTVEAFAHDYALPLEKPLAQVRRHLDGFPLEAPVTFEASFSPPLDYYTGLVFEITGRRGEVLASGGQYDRLLERLGASSPIAASGCALWADRLEQETLA